MVGQIVFVGFVVLDCVVGGVLCSLIMFDFGFGFDAGCVVYRLVMLLMTIWWFGGGLRC